ncbi:hypothetical protein [Gloeobacter morelensis]|uniref:Uncharacterized protein n=1 Tax=Gloeobacter morelensis MG652769 TaxID=2781736 RepID=A0ABY3PPK8_9CYAN|nr:hypothetical protein [Gloeobacter morelensis]UFP95574.1 hypothetical protein ISF26_04830 [Gloeobacter morelensis MG652769]
MYKRLGDLVVFVAVFQIALSFSCPATALAIPTRIATAPGGQLAAVQESFVFPRQAPFSVSRLENLAKVSTSAQFLKSGKGLDTPAVDGFSAQKISQDSAPPPSASQAASEAIDPSEDSNRWHFKLQPYLTIPISTYGNVTVGGRTTNYDLGLGSLLSAFTFTASARVESWVDNLGFIIDAYYVKLDAAETVSLSVADIGTSLSFQQGIYDFALSYHLGAPAMFRLPDKPSNKPFPLFWFEPIVGTRLNSLNSTIGFRLGSQSLSVNSGRTWFEPMVGAKVGLQLSDPVTLWLRGDVSGFGLAGAQDLSWNFLAGGDLWVAPTVSLQLAYRLYEIDYANGDSTFVFNQSFNGPFVAATFNF